MYNNGALLSFQFGYLPILQTLQFEFFLLMPDFRKMLFLDNDNLSDNVCLEKGSDDVGPAVCDTIYTIYLSLFTQTADPT